MNKPFYIGQYVNLKPNSRHKLREMEGTIVDGYFNSQPNYGKTEKDWVLLILYNAKAGGWKYIERYLYEVELIK